MAPTGTLSLHAFAFIIVLLATCISEHTAAQRPTSLASNYIRTDFTVEDGLPDDVVNAVIQDGNGLLWVGTGSGLATFDGREFKRIPLSFPGVPSQGSIHVFEAASNGDLWVGTSAGLVFIPKKELNQLNPAAASFFPLGEPRNNEVQALLVTRQGMLWVGTNHGLYKLESGKFIKARLSESIIRLAEASNGHLLVVTQRGYLEFDGQNVIEHPEVAKRLGVHDDQIFNVFQDRSGTVWYGTFRGAMREGKHSFPLFKPSAVAQRAVYRTYEDPNGNIWISADSGTFRANGNQLEALAPGVGARCFYASPDGELWMGTNGAGLVHFKPRLVQMYTKADGLPTDIVMAVLADHEGKLWVGNNCGGLTLFERSHVKNYSEKDGLANSCVWALAEDHSGDLWIGSYGGGLFKLHDGHFTQYSIGQGLVSKVVLQIAVARDNSLWIATPDGLSHMEKGQFTNYTTAQGLSSDNILGVHQDLAGTIWAASQGGVDSLTGDGFRPLASNGLGEGNSEIGFAEDSRGDLYTADSSKGIGLIKNGRLISVDDDLNVMGMVESPDHDLWFSSKNGIVRIALDDLRRWVPDRNSPLNYDRFDRADGLNSTQSSTGTPNIAITPDHRLWVATVKGLAMVDLDRLPATSQKPSVFLSEVTVEGRKQPFGNELILPAGTHHVELHLAAVNLGSPEKTRVQYRLDGVDSNWLDSDISRTAVYTTIPVGKHAFHLRATGSDGKWDREGVVYSLTQKPLLYQQNWFQFACAAALLVVLTVIYLARVRQIVSQTRMLLETRIAERERIARDLHDTLLQGVQGLILRFHDAMQDVPPNSKTRDSLESALEVADEVILEARNRVKRLRSEALENADLPQSLQKVGIELNHQNDLQFRVVVKGTVVAIQPSIGEELFFIGREGITNAFLHARSSEVEVEIDYGLTAFRLSCRDNGVGIDSAILHDKTRDGHWGILGMRERSKKIGGEFNIRNQRSGGTEIEVIVPARRSYLGRIGTLRSIANRILPRQD
jgi:signal transduction histidine kinase/ligand-binding sensor domain-containing protein